MRILVVTQYFPPEAVPLPDDLAQGLAKRGHQVKVLTGYPNYPIGRIFDGYQQKRRFKERRGLVEVHRVPLYPDHSTKTLKRVLNYLSFAFSSAAARRLSRGADVIYVYATQMTAGFGPWLWRITGGKPYVLHIQDIWPDSVIGSSVVEGATKERVISAVLKPWLRSAYRRAAAVVAIAPTMAETLVQRGVPSGKTHVVYNWAHAGVSTDSAPPTDGGERTEIVYAGNVGDMQDLPTAIYAAHRSADVGVTLTILGDGVARPKLQELVESLGAKNVRFQAAVPREQMSVVYAHADYALVTLKDLPAFRGTIPSKLQGALAFGLPIISTVQGDVRDLVERGGVGLTADASDIVSLEATFRAAALQTSDQRDSMAQRAKRMHETLFSAESGISKIERLLAAAAKGIGSSDG